MGKQLVRSIGIAALAAPLVVLAHGEGGGMMGLGTMGEMMTFMHEHLDESAAVDCDAMTDEMLMEHGEEMMEEMIGHEDHERIEEAMEEDMADHDAMHVMMGMMASGCVGDEAGASIAARYAAPQAPAARTGSGGMLAIGLVGGVVLGFLGAGFLKKKPADVPAPPAS